MNLQNNYLDRSNDMENINLTPATFLRNKRKELGLTQDDFAEVFDMTKDTYRRYETGERIPPENLYRTMKLLISHYENSISSADALSVNNFLENARTESLKKIFCAEQHEIVNIIFDYLTRKAKHDLA